MRKFIAILMLALSESVFALDAQQHVEALVDALSHLDVLPAGVTEVGLSEVIGHCAEELGCETNQFVDAVRTYCTNICVRGNMSNRLDRARFKGTLMLLDEFAQGDSLETFAFCVTNNADPTLAGYSMLAYAKACDVDGALAFHERAGEALSAEIKKDAVCKGVLSAFVLNGGDVQATNAMVRFGLSALSSRSGCWGALDEHLCDWWPDYATSSNRYVAAQRALQTVPPPASSNYLNRVIAELEALPPGTMRMLSTNHLGQAWQE